LLFLEDSWRRAKTRLAWGDKASDGSVHALGDRLEVAVPFTALFIAHAPDADPEKHRAVVDTGHYKLFTVVVRDQQQALAVCRKMVAEEGVNSVLLCPGNSNEDVGGISAAVGDQVSVSVARGDSSSMRVAARAMEEAGWFAAQARN
jgi:hypothetical protein